MSQNLGIIEILIMQTLLYREKYGLEIIESIKEEGTKTVSLGSLYPTLHRLERKGYVKSRWGEATLERGGNRRKYYKLTGSGEKALNDVRHSLQPLLKWGVQGA